jgi:hypothetical protein
MEWGGEVSAVYSSGYDSSCAVIDSENPSEVYFWKRFTVFTLRMSVCMPIYLKKYFRLLGHN